MSWDWNVGQDRIDIGYDLCITPDQNIYRGIRFLVQVKGTAVSSKRPKALVASSRLRQYAASILPVFILRVASDKTIYWVHAQAWAATNKEVLLDKKEEQSPSIQLGQWRTGNSSNSICKKALDH